MKNKDEKIYLQVQPSYNHSRLLWSLQTLYCSVYFITSPLMSLISFSLSLSRQCSTADILKTIFSVYLPLHFLSFYLTLCICLYQYQSDMWFMLMCRTYWEVQLWHCRRCMPLSTVCQEPHAHAAHSTDLAGMWLHFSW